MRDFGKENNASASAGGGGLRDYDKHSVVSNTMQKVSFVLYFAQSLGCDMSGRMYFMGPLKRNLVVFRVTNALSFVNLYAK